MSTARVYAVWGCVVSLGFASLGVVWKYAGLLGVAAYVTVLCALGWAGGLLMERLGRSGRSRRAVDVCLVLFLVVLAVAFFAIYPIADAGIVGGGSDSDDALDLAVGQMFAGVSPYARATYLGNPVTPLPGAILLAAPFVVLGSSAGQCLFWVVAFVLLLGRWLSREIALGALVAMLGFAPVVWTNTLTGTDHLANAIYVAVFLFWVLRASSDPRSGFGWVVPAVVFGIALSSRTNFLLLVPVVFATVAKRSGARIAVATTATCLVVFAAVTAPVLFGDGLAAIPLAAQRGKLLQLRAALPYADFLIPAAAAIASGALALKWMNGSVSRLMWAAAIVQAIPVLFMVGCLLVLFGASGLAACGYGVFSLPFALTAVGLAVKENSSSSEI